MSGAVIYAAIVVVWAIVLVPRWLRKHDAIAAAAAERVERERREATEAVEREERRERELHGRVLERRARPAHRPAADGAGDGAGDEAGTTAYELVDDAFGAGEEPYEPAPYEGPGRTTSAVRTARAHRTVQRHRLVFGGLLLAAFGCGGAAAYGTLPWWSVLAPVLLLPPYLVHVRRVIVAEHARRRHAQRAARLARADETAIGSPLRTGRGSDADEAAGSASFTEDGVPEGTASVAAYRARRVPAGMHIVDRDALFDQLAPEPWLPRPVPLPTYLTAPAAPRAYESTVSVDEYDETAAPDQDATVHEFRRAAGG